MRLLLGLLLVGNGLLAQTSLQPRRIFGVVLDSAGKPVVGADIQHTGDNGAGTDSSGHFDLTVGVPTVVIRKVGFESYFLRTDQAEGVRIVLRPAQAIGACKLAAIPSHTVRFLTDIDYTGSTTSVQTKNGPAVLLCGEGGLWTSGIPRDSLVWRSVEYAESVSPDYGGVVDARGKTSEGWYWRYRGIPGSSCSYERVDRETAAALDCLMGKTPGR